MSEPDLFDDTDNQPEESGGLESPSPEESDRAGAKAGDAVAAVVGSVTANCILFLARITPGGWKFGRGLIRAGYKAFYKSSGNIDTIGHICIGNQIKHVPLRYDHDAGRYETLEDDPEYWYSPSAAQNEYRVGPVPAVWASARTNELGSHVQAEVAEALDLGAGNDLYTDAQVQHITVEQTGAGQAVADGGTAATQQWTEEINIHDPGQLQDQLVDLDHGLPDDATARVTSMEKYYETYPEVATTEEMELQEWRGIQMAKDDEELRDMMVKLLLIAGGIIVASLAAAFVLPSLLGGGGGGGGGVLPLVAGWF